MLQAGLAFTLLFAVAIAVFAVQNTTPVPVTFLAWRTEGIAASVLVLVAAALGAALMLTLGFVREWRLRWRLRSMARDLAAAQARLDRLQAASPDPPGPTVPNPGARSETQV